MNATPSFVALRVGAGIRRALHGLLTVLGTLALAVSTPAQSAASASSAPDDLYEQARVLFEQLPPELRVQFDFPTREQWTATLTRLQGALEGDSLADLAALATDARAALQTLRLVPGYEDLADWLSQRVDEIEGAQQALAPTPAPRPPAPQTPTRPGVPRPPPPPASPAQPVPHYNLWLARVQSRSLPPHAPTLVPKLRAIFAAEGIPPELVWLAEAESSFNPSARSPVGARGLFQFMPDTAKAHGLSTLLPDERTDPEKSARAAARYLRQLHARFGNWALALAAYNAGEGRVSRTLAAKKADTFTAIADALPAETRMYVPKVCALIATRAGVAPHQIPPPGPAHPPTKSTPR